MRLWCVVGGGRVEESGTKGNKNGCGGDGAGDFSVEGRDFAGEAGRGDAAAPSGDYQCGDAEGGAAGRSSGVAVRRALQHYTLLGLRCETTSGLKRKLLVLTERIACRCAHRVICVSESLRQKAIELGIVDAERTVVFASGVSSGPMPSDSHLHRRFAARRANPPGIRNPAEAPVIGFVGRLTKDKGISELVDAYLELRRRIPELRLLLVGEMEEGEPLPAATRRCLESEQGVLRTGFVEDPADYYHVMDVFAIPTYREGFGNVALEANAAGKPVVAFRATGAADAVVDAE